MSTQKTLIALLAGAALGAVAGVLLAPASGEETRHKLNRKAGDLRDQMTDLIDKGNSLVNDVKDTAKDASAKASKTVKHTMDEAKDSFNHAKTAATKA